MLEKQRTKKWAPKSFGGCLTCKKRRIKCDELKPFCRRCSRSGLPCEGYAPPAVRLFDPLSQNSSRPGSSRRLFIIPNDDDDESDKTSSSHDDIEPKTIPGDSKQVLNLESPLSSVTSLLPRHGSAEEQRSFQFFLEKTMGLISIYSRTHFWSVIVPQSTWHEPAIKHSTMALAILHESLTRHGEVPLNRNRQLLYHYNAAIRALTQGQPSIDVVLITCVIFWTLENFQGNYATAEKHTLAAVKILSEWHASFRGSTHQSPTYRLIKDHIEPTLQLALNFLGLGRIEDGAFSEITSVSSTPETASDQAQVLQPLSFSSLREASSNLFTYIECIIDLFSLRNDENAEIKIIKHAVVDMRSQLDKWINLFPKLTSIKKPFEVRLLSIHHIAAGFLLDELDASINGDEACEPASPKAHLQYIVTEVNDMLETFNKPSSHDHSSDLAELILSQTVVLIPPLFLAAVRCQEPGVRQKAIETLRSLHDDGGEWNTGLAANVAETISHLEDNLKAATRHGRTGSVQDFCMSGLLLERRNGTENNVYMVLRYECGGRSPIIIEERVQCTKEQASSISWENITSIVHTYGYKAARQNY